MAVYAGQAVLGKDFASAARVFGAETAALQHAGKLTLHLFIGDAFHMDILLFSGSRRVEIFVL